jgi:hypothetical protein
MTPHRYGCTCKLCRPLEFALNNNPYAGSGVRTLQPNIRLHRNPNVAVAAFVVIDQLRDPA